MKKKPVTITLFATSSIADLVAVGVLDELTHAELVVLLRLLVARERYLERRMPVRNRELYDDPRTVGRALAKLAKRGVVRVRSDASGQRTIEVVR